MTYIFETKYEKQKALETRLTQRMVKKGFQNLTKRERQLMFRCACLEWSAQQVGAGKRRRRGGGSGIIRWGMRLGKWSARLTKLRGCYGY